MSDAASGLRLKKSWQSINHIGVFATEMDDNVVVYNPQSGETHQLNILALDALQFMQQPANISQLTKHMCVLYDTHDSDDLNDQLKNLLEQFDDLGLIESVNE